MLKRFWKKARTALGAPRAQVNRKEPSLESLETRQMLSGTSTDYGLSGFSWANPGRITYSFPSDAAYWDQGQNNLNAKLDAAYGGTSWERTFAEALQTWAASANINVVPVTDSNADFNSAGLAQGDPNFGDIRVGGYDFQNNQVLAQTYYPPPNGVTGSGDVEVNTAYNWGPGAPFDFYSVMLHETGHSLGLEDLSNSTSVENTIYGGVRTGLMPGDIAGIQAIYGPRVADQFQSIGQATSIATAVDLTTPIVANNGHLIVWNPSLNTIGDTEYYSFVAPAGANETLRAEADAYQISSLSPKITVFDSSMNPLGTAGNAAAWSDNPTINLANIQAGHRYYVEVTGATNDVFSVGAYALQLTFTGTNPPPAPPTVIVTPTPVTPPVTTTPPVTPPPVSPPPTTPPPVAPQPPAQPTVLKDRFDPIYTHSQPVSLGTITQKTVGGLTLDSGSDMNLFTFFAAKAGTVTVSTGSTMITVINMYGQKVAVGTGTVSFAVAKPSVRYFLVLSSATGQANPGFGLAISLAAPAGRVKASRVAVVVKSTTKPSAQMVAAPTPAPDVARKADWRHQRVAVVAKSPT